MDLLDIHRASLEQWRYSMNLVGPGPIEPHYQDCKEALDSLSPAGYWADLGSGAGFPGIIFADRFPHVRLDLVESRKKRCVFLQHVLAQAMIPESHVSVRCLRVEELSPIYDGVLSRAFAPPNIFLDYAAQLLHPNGQVVLFLGDQEPPSHPMFQWVFEHRYVIDDKPRCAVHGKRIAST